MQYDPTAWLEPPPRPLAVNECPAHPGWPLRADGTCPQCTSSRRNLIADAAARVRAMKRGIRRARPAKTTTAAQPAAAEETPTMAEAKQITHDGKTQTVREWAATIGVSPQTLHQRLQDHSIAEALAMGGPSRGRPATRKAATNGGGAFDAPARTEAQAEGVRGGAYRAA